MDLLTIAVVRSALQKAWKDSEPGVWGAHEEGGFILREVNGDLSVARWPRGEKAYIIIPSHPGCRFDEKDIIATFHTHPNTGKSYDQHPNPDDIRAVLFDRDLKAVNYVGEFVISAETIYCIRPDGSWDAVAPTSEVFDVNDNH